MAEEISPAIDPSAFDLVVYGTGLPESLLAAAAAAAGKSVLHLDRNPFYGSHFSSLSPHSLLSFLQQTTPPPPPPPAIEPSAHENVLGIEPRRVYTDVEVHGEVPEPSGSFLLDVSGPRVLYCADPMVDVMLRSGASHHVDFKSVDATLCYWDGRLCTVPDSREGIFKDRDLGLTEKSRMMAFLKLVRGHVEGDAEISVEDLEMPFMKFMEKQRLPEKIRSIVLYAIAMTDYDQDSLEDCKRLVKTREGLESLTLYNKSVGRFPSAVGAFIYPIYGQGELPQAFCRCAAIKGALYVLRMPLAGLLIDKESRLCKGVRLGSGQDISCQQLVVDPSFTVLPSISPDFSKESLEEMNRVKASKVVGKVARMICITRRSVQPHFSNVLVVFPPKSLHSEQMTTIRALQLSSNVAFCPPGLFLLYLSTPCENTILGKEYLRDAVDALCKIPENNETTNLEGSQDDTESPLLWNVIYIHELTQVSHRNFFSCAMPDSSLDYSNLLETTVEIFQTMYPQEEFISDNLTKADSEDGSSADVD